MKAKKMVALMLGVTMLAAAVTGCGGQGDGGSAGAGDAAGAGAHAIPVIQIIVLPIRIYALCHNFAVHLFNMRAVLVDQIVYTEALGGQCILYILLLLGS